MAICAKRFLPEQQAVVGREEQIKSNIACLITLIIT